MEIQTLDDLIKLYNPANASKLTADQINAIKDLDDDQIKALAEAYPNKSMGNAYLVLYDTSKPPEKQLYSLSTWKNLKAVRDMGKKNFIPFAFRANMPSERAATVKAIKGNADSPAAKFVDLSTDELAKLSNVKKTVGNTNTKVPAAANTGKVVTPAPPAGEGKDKVVIPEGGEGKDKDLPPVDETHPLVIAVRTEEKELAQLNEDKAHHMTIKSQEAKVATAKEAAAAEGIIVPPAPAAASTEQAPEQ